MSKWQAGPAERRVRHAIAALVMACATTGCDAGMEQLHKAAITGNAEVVKSWISQKRNLDVTYDEPESGLEGNYSRARGITALMVAARAGHLEIAKLLVEGGANLYLQSHWRDGSNPRSAFDYAVEYATARPGGIEMVKYLWNRSDRVRFASRLDEQIFAICTRTCNEKHGGNADTNLALFLIGIAPDSPRGRGISQAACYSQQPIELLGFLEKRGVRFPKNTLHCAAFVEPVRGLRTPAERIAIVSFFLDHGADLEDPGQSYTALMGAASTHDLEMVKFLLARGANPNTLNNGGVTAIGLAANICTTGTSAMQARVEARQRPQLAVIEHLLQSGADTRLYATERARSQMDVLVRCCGRQPHTGLQRRICEVFGL